MRILICHGAGPEQFPSGELSVVERESSYLKRQGHVVELLVNHSSLGWNPLRLFFSLVKNRALKEKICSFRPDIVHFHSVTPYLGLAELAIPKRYGLPVVQTLHNGRWLCVEGGYFRDGKFCDACVGHSGLKGVMYGCGRGYMPALFLFLVNRFARSRKWLFYKVDRFIAVSDFVRRQHVVSGFPADQLKVNNNGIDIVNLEQIGYAKSWTERTGVAFVGRISDAKGAAVVKQIIPMIQQPFHIVGNGPALDSLKQFCESHGYEQVLFWGKQSREKTLEVLGSVICSIVPSQCGDSFPTVALESMAVGTPVVASNLGGLPALVSTDRGIVVEATDFEQYANAVLKYIDHIELAQRDGNNGISYARENLSIQTRGNALVKIYEELLSQL